MTTTMRSRVTPSASWVEDLDEEWAQLEDQSGATIDQTVSADVAGSVEVAEFPFQLIDRYVRSVALRAFAEEMEDGRWFACAVALPEVWADGDTEQGALDALPEVTRQWVLLKIEDRDRDIPIVGHIDLNRI